VRLCHRAGVPCAAARHRPARQCLSQPVAKLLAADPPAWPCPAAPQAAALMRWEPGTDARWGWGQPAVRRAAARRVGPLSCSRFRTPLPLYGLCLCGLAEAGGEWPSGPVGTGTTMMGWAGVWGRETWSRYRFRPGYFAYFIYIYAWYIVCIQNFLPKIMGIQLNTHEYMWACPCLSDRQLTDWILE